MKGDAGGAYNRMTASFMKTEMTVSYWSMRESHEEEIMVLDTKKERWTMAIMMVTSKGCKPGKRWSDGDVQKERWAEGERMERRSSWLLPEWDGVLVSEERMVGGSCLGRGNLPEYPLEYAGIL